MASALLCVCAGCIRGEDRSQEFYDLLGVHRSASPSELRSAWRRVSLQNHPDKLAQRGRTVTADDQAAFARLKEAYSVLSDPVKRRIYDEFGANGVKWTEDPTSIDPQVALSNFTKSSQQDRCRILSAVGGVLVFCLLFPIFLGSRIDGSRIPWIIVFAPLWILELAWLSLQTSVLMALRAAEQEMNDEVAATSKWDRDVTKQATMVHIASLGLHLTWQFLLALQLSGVPLSYFTSLLPLLMVEVLALAYNYRLVRMPIEMFPGGAEPDGFDPEDSGAAEDPSSAEARRVMQVAMKRSARRSLGVHFLLLLWEILIVSKLSGALPVSWWIVFLPLWLLFSADISVDVFQLWAFAKNGLDVSDEEVAAASGAFMNGCHACFVVSVLLVIAVLSVLKLDGASFSAAWIFFPVFVLAGLIFCCLSCIVCCAVDPDTVAGPESQRRPSYTPLREPEHDGDLGRFSDEHGEDDFLTYTRNSGAGTQSEEHPPLLADHPPTTSQPHPAPAVSNSLVELD